MQVIPSAIPEVMEIRPKVFGDDRGFFMETWNAQAFAAAGIETQFVQDNHSLSKKGTLRGLHYQLENPQGKLVRVTRGQVFDVAVDMRQSSPTFGQSVSCVLCSEKKNQFWVPAGFAHGFYVMSDEAEFLYKCTDFYSPQSERSLLWNDPKLDIQWPLVNGEPPLLSDKDAAAKCFAEADYYS